VHFVGLFLSLLKMHGPKNKEDRQCTYNVTLRRLIATIVAVEKQ